MTDLKLPASIEQLSVQFNQSEQISELGLLTLWMIIFFRFPKPLQDYEKEYGNQKKAIVKAYLSGGYTLKEIGNYFGKHYSTISRIVKSNE